MTKKAEDPENPEDAGLLFLPDGTVREAKTGRFPKGWSGGPGAGHVAKLRRAVSSSITEQDLKRVMRKLVNLALDGDVQAAKLLLDRCLGKLPTNLKLIEDKSLTVQIRNLSDKELADLERLALKAIPTEARVVEPEQIEQTEENE